MSVNKLCVALRRIAVGRISNAVASRSCSTRQSNCDTNVFSRPRLNSHGISHCTGLTHNIKFIPGTLNIDFGIPRDTGVRSIVEMPVARIPPLREPAAPVPIQYDSPAAEKIVDLPAIGEIYEKQAVRLIVIRRRKMKKHKRKKLRKKMEKEWAKVRQKRVQKREKALHAELIGKVKAAQAFDPKEYVRGRLNILNRERIPRTYRGEILPLEMIKKLREDKKRMLEQRRNIPRITL